MKRKHYFILVAWIFAAVVLLVLIGVLLIPRSIRNFFYPTASGMPPVVNLTMDEILGKLEIQLQSKAPKVLLKLQPGLSESAISALERKYGITLPDDLKTMYRWHDGSSTRDPMLCGPIPGHWFLPLDEALGSSGAITNQLAKATGAQQAAFNVFAGHRKSWIPLFDDGSGDGYFFDPKRKAPDGAVFYHFAEDAHYVFFPSVKNLMAAAVKCYEQDAFAWKTNDSGTGLMEDFEQSQKVWPEFGASNVQ